MKKPLIAFALGICTLPLASQAFEATTIGSVAGSAAGTTIREHDEHHRHREIVFVSVADDAAALLAGESASAELLSAMELAREEIAAEEGSHAASTVTAIELSQHILMRAAEASARE